MENKDLAHRQADRAGHERSPSTGSSPFGDHPLREPEWPLCGYAPGSYCGKCHDCGDTFIGDKRALQCLACAVASAKKGLESIRKLQAERDAYRTQAINRGWNWKLCDAYGKAEYESLLASEVDKTTEIMLGKISFADSLRDSDGNPEGEKPQALSAQHDSAGPEGIAQTQSQ